MRLYHSQFWKSSMFKPNATSTGLAFASKGGLTNTKQRPRWRQGCLINISSSVLTVQSSVAICDWLVFDLVHHKLASCLQRNFLIKYFYLLGSISRQGSYITGLTVLKKNTPTPCCVMMCVCVRACVCEWVCVRVLVR